MNSIPRSIAFALMLGIGFGLSSAHANGQRDDSYFLTDENGKKVVWPQKTVTYTYVRQLLRFEGNIGTENCDKTESVNTLLQRSNMTFTWFHEQIVEAFQRWERRVGHLRFVYVKNGDADILIGAHEKPPTSIAFANLFLGKGAAYRPIRKGVICLNSAIKWGREFSPLVVAVHEIGHVIGLTHPTKDKNDSVMGYQYVAGNSVPNKGDENAAQLLYGKPKE